MILRTPHFGPHAGRLCVVRDDGKLEPVPEAPPSGGGPPVCLPDVPDVTPGVVSGPGEISGYATRDSRDRMIRSIVEHHGTEHAEWAARKVENAVRTWDSGIRDGRIARRRD